jgi:intein-encoded DNA endonuclease-like protein
VAVFIRGFADSEGSVDKNGNIIIYNTDLRLLTYVKELLRRFGIESIGPRLCIQRGTITRDPKTGKHYSRNKDCYYLYIRVNSNMSFYRYMGFTIRRKQMWLESYIKRTTRIPTPSPNHFPTDAPTLIISIN